MTDSHSSGEPNSASSKPTSPYSTFASGKFGENTPEQPDGQDYFETANSSANSSTDGGSSIDDVIAKRNRHVSDPRWPLFKAARLGGIAIACLAVVSLLAWGGQSGMRGVWGALIGSVIGGAFVLLTIVSVLITSRTNPQTTMAVVMGTWLLKVVVVLLVLVVLKNMYFYDHLALAVTVIAALIVGLVSETWGVLTARVTYIADREWAEERDHQQ
ncbi:hypothetical protein [Corynebacterium pseudokroppenstedtii]|uniref:hypothetical protein n=1 Tax=Corynebacterium pseudokroppenstedtii TaxID=2804917 RepID=UPI0029151CDF|nr:hypothetical protein [Corynebacterium kroppenstedtii]